jgi:hypothetical protein
VFPPEVRKPYAFAATDLIPSASDCTVVLSLHAKRSVLPCRVRRRNGIGQLKQPTEFGATVNGNMVDIAVLEWCKLFADRRGHHHWTRLVRPDLEQRQFLMNLLDVLQVNEAAWRQYLDEFRVYRDKFVAHLDMEDVARIPQLEMALQSTYFLYARLLVDAPAGTFDMPGRVSLPRDLPTYFASCQADSRSAYAQVT